MARKAEWENLKERSAKRFGEDSVFGEGTLGSRLAVVGEAPGKREVEEGRPFVGNAGRLLDELLDEAGIERSKVYVTNVVKIRPTKENNGRTQNRPPRAGEIREGIEVLEEELGLIKPRPGTPRRHAGEGPDQEILHPQIRPRRPVRLGAGIPTLATYHPAYLLRLGGVGSEDYDRLRGQVVEDLGAAWQRASGDG
jgi:uracil-DNA glycosylase